jgi:hypothetical protein
VEVSLQILARISAYTSAIKPASSAGRKTLPHRLFPKRKTSQLRKPPAAAQHHKLKKKMERNLFAGSFHCVKI